MKGYNVYSKVQQLREAGFSQRAVADTLKINRKTVKRYWDMPIEEYEAKHQKTVRIQNKSHQRDRTTALDQLQEELDEQLQNKATDFLQRIREEKSRYARDQFRLLQSLLDRFGTEQTLDAISFCLSSNLCSVNTVRDYLEHRAEEKEQELPFTYPSQIPVNDPKYHITTQKRALSVYAKVGGQI